MDAHLEEVVVVGTLGHVGLLDVDDEEASSNASGC